MRSFKQFLEADSPEKKRQDAEIKLQARQSITRRRNTLATKTNQANDLNSREREDFKREREAIQRDADQLKDK